MSKLFLRKKTWHPATATLSLVPFARKAGTKPIVKVACMALGTESAPINGHGEFSVRRACLSLDARCQCGKKHKVVDTVGESRAPAAL